MSKPRVLVAEDAAISRRKIVAILEKLDCDVKEAEDGEATISHCESFKPELIVLDLYMPEKDGLEVLQILRANPQFKQTTIVVLTGEANTIIVRQAIAQGANDYLLKTDTLSNLQDRLEKHIDVIRQRPPDIE
jgi:CheY-like chemotaxis protein